jgi:hypothetical protein
MWRFSQRHLKSQERFFIPNNHFYRTDRFPERKGRTAVAVRKGTPHNHLQLPPIVSTETSRIFIPFRNIEVLLAAVCKSEATPGMVQVSLSSQALDVSRFWQEI